MPHEHSITDFMADGALPALAEALSDLAGVQLTLRDTSGRVLEYAPEKNPPWVAGDIESLSQQASVQQLHASGDALGMFVVEPSPLPPTPTPARLAEVTRLLANTVSQMCRQQLELSDRNDQLRVLIDLCELLVGAAELDEVLALCVRAAASLSQYPGGTIHIIEPDSNTLKLGSAFGIGKDFAGALTALPASRIIDAKVFDDVAVMTLGGEDLLGAIGYEQMNKAGVKHVVSVGLPFRGEVQGLLRLYGRQDTLSSTAKATLRAAAELIGAAVASASLIESRRRARQNRRQLALAQQVQKRMLPPEPPAIDGLDIGACFKSSLELSGDFYDLVEDDGGLLLIVGDLAGKGIPAALQMASVRSAFRAYANTAEPPACPAKLLTKLNNAMCRETMPGEFATVFLARIDRKQDTLTYACAGHDPPVIARALHTGEPQEEDAPIQASLRRLEHRQLVAGVVEDIDYEAVVEPFTRSDVLIVNTDGATDAMNYSDERYTRERFHGAIEESVAHTPALNAQLLCDHLHWHIRRYIGLRRESDDLSIVAVRSV